MEEPGASASAAVSRSPYSLAGKTILVTGASSGIGQACARLAAGMGATVILSGRDQDRLNQTAESLAGDRHLVKPLDLADDAALLPWVETVGPLDGVAHCAGIALVAPFRMVSARHLDTIIGVNLRAPLLLTQALLRAKKINPDASLVFVTAVADHVAPAGTAAYSAAKAGLDAAVRSLALETAKQRIRANCVSPGYVKTPMLEQLAKSSSIEDLKQLSPLGLIEPEEVAPSVIYLLSPASRWVTRGRLVVDGGITVPVR